MLESAMMERYIPTIKSSMKMNRCFIEDVFQDACIAVLQEYRKDKSKLNDGLVNCITKTAMIDYHRRENGRKYGHKHGVEICSLEAFNDDDFIYKIKCEGYTGLTEQEFSVFCSQIKWDDKIAKVFEAYVTRSVNSKEFGLTPISMNRYVAEAAKRIRDNSDEIRTWRKKWKKQQKEILAKKRIGQ